MRDHLLYIMKDGARIYGSYDEDYIFIIVSRNIDLHEYEYNPLLGIDRRLSNDEQIRQDRVCLAVFKYTISTGSYQIEESSTEGYSMSELTLLFTFTAHHIDEYIKYMGVFRKLDELYDKYGTGLYECPKQILIRRLCRKLSDKSLNFLKSKLLDYTDFDADWIEQLKCSTEDEKLNTYYSVYNDLVDIGVAQEVIC